MQEVPLALVVVGVNADALEVADDVLQSVPGR